MTDLTSATSLISITLASVSITGAVANTIAAARRTRKQLAALRATSVDATLASGRIELLGALLTEELGSTNLTDYANNEELRRTFQKTLDSTLRFLDPVTDAPLSTQSPGNAQNWSRDASIARESRERKQFEGKPVRTPELEQAYDALIRGELWDAMSRARFVLEQHLRTLLEPETSGNRKLGTTSMLRLLASRGKIPPEAVDDLLRATATASRAIHGEDVGQREATHALAGIDVYLDRTRNKS